MVGSRPRNGSPSSILWAALPPVRGLSGRRLRDVRPGRRGRDDLDGDVLRFCLRSRTGSGGLLRDHLGIRSLLRRSFRAARRRASGPWACGWFRIGVCRSRSTGRASQPRPGGGRPGPFCFLLGLSSMLMTRKFQRLGDLAAGTMVIVEERRPRLGLVRIQDPRSCRFWMVCPCGSLPGRTWHEPCRTMSVAGTDSATHFVRKWRNRWPGPCDPGSACPQAIRPMPFCVPFITGFSWENEHGPRPPDRKDSR